MTTNTTARVTVLLVVCCALTQAQRNIRPGWNLFSKEQDVQLGKEASVEIEKQVQVVDDKQLSPFVERIGKKLAAHAQDNDYPFTFKLVADESINAFALPGGPTYVHSGLIAAADNEAQLAGVMAHEIGHVVLRHGTNQASKAQLWQLPALIAGGLLDQKGGMLASLGQLGIGLGVNSVLMKYSRSAEKDADIVGARMMAAAGYDPIEMARFFEKLRTEGGGGIAQFFSDHPDPGNRVEYVTEEVRLMPKRNYVKNTGDFGRMKSRAASIKPDPKKQPAAQGGPESSQGGGELTLSNGRYSNQVYAVTVPQSWKAFAGQDNVSITTLPANGAVKMADGGTGLARAALAGVFASDAETDGGLTALIRDLQGSNPGMRELDGQRRSMRIGGQIGRSTFLQGVSPLRGQREYTWIVAVKRPEGLFYLAMVSPESEYNQLSPLYEQVVKSVRFE